MPHAKIYLDYAATTSVDRKVLRAMQPYFGAKFGNAGSLHSFGQETIAALDASRETIAKAINADFREIIFTGSATEANNLALRGALSGIMNNELRMAGRGNGGVGNSFIHHSPFIIPKIIVSAIEHESVLETARDMEKEGAEVVVISVDKRGLIDMKKLRAAIDERTVLVSVMYANNEIGTVEPISEISKYLRDFRSTKSEARNTKQIQNPNFKDSRRFNPDIVSDFGFRYSDFGTAYPLFHVDAVQAFQFLDCNADALGVDLMTLSAHKIYGPKGVGALYVRGARKNHESRIMNNGQSDSSIIHHSPFILPIITGGGQEFGLRSGTENIPSIVGFARAVELVSARRKRENERIWALGRYYIDELKKIYPKLEVNGIENIGLDSRLRGNDKTTPRLPNILNVHIPGARAEELLTRWDIAGLAASAGSACSARSYEPSHVIKALGYPGARAKESIRFSFGALTTKGEVDKALRIIENAKISAKGGSASGGKVTI